MCSFNVYLKKAEWLAYSSIHFVTTVALAAVGSEDK